MTTNAKNTLFVMSGGGLPGIDIHAGIWLALEERGIVADDISGTSAGAIVGALDAAGWKAAGFADHLRRYDTDQLCHYRPFWKFRLPWIDSIMDNDRVAAALEGMLPLEWSGFRKSFFAWAVNKRTGNQVNVARPELTAIPAEAILASMAICGLFPAVALDDGEEYIDGGVRFNLPLPPNWMDYGRIYLLIAKQRPQDYRGTGVVSNLVRNVNVMMLDQIYDVLDATRGAPNVTVIWPDISGAGSMLRFDHTLIDAARAYTLRTLDHRENEK